MKTCPLFSSDLLSSIPENLHFQSISEQSLQSLAALNKLIENIGLYFRGKRRKEEHCQRLQQNITQLNSAEFRANLDNYRKECDYLKIYRANMALKNLLATNIWEKWEQLGSKTQLNQLKMFWQRNSETNHLSYEALLVIKEDILPTLEHFNQLCVLERKYHRGSLPKKVSELLKAYQKEVRAYINSLRNQVCDAMLVRLQVISKSNNIYQGDVNFYLVNRLSHLGINLSEAINRKYKILTQQQFVTFHHYVNQYGTQQQKISLRRLPWFENDQQFSVSESCGQLTIMPSIPPIKNRAFSLLPWLEKFFDWFNGEQNYFDTKFHLLAQIRLQEKNNHIEQCSLESLLTDDYWRRLTLFENDLLAEQSKLDIFISSSWNETFHPSLYASSVAFKKCVQKALIRNIENKIAYTELLAQQLRTRLVFDLETNLMSSGNLKEFVAAIIKDIENALIKIRPENSPIETWDQTKCLLQIYLSGEKKPPEKDESQVQLENKEQSNFVAIDVAIKNIIAKASANNIFDLKSLNTNMISLQRLFELKSSKIEKDLLFWKQLSICYLNTCITLGTDNSLLKDLKKIIFKFGHRELVSSAGWFDFFHRDMNLTTYIKYRSSLLQTNGKGLVSLELSRPRQRVA